MTRSVMRLHSSWSTLAFLILLKASLFMPSVAGAQSKGENPDFVKLLEKTDSLVTFTDSDFSAVYTFVQETPGQGRT